MRFQPSPPAPPEALFPLLMGKGDDPHLVRSHVIDQAVREPLDGEEPSRTAPRCPDIGKRAQQCVGSFELFNKTFSKLRPASLPVVLSGIQ